MLQFVSYQLFGENGVWHLRGTGKWKYLESSEDLKKYIPDFEAQVKAFYAKYGFVALK